MAANWLGTCFPAKAAAACMNGRGSEVGGGGRGRCIAGGDTPPPLPLICLSLSTSPGEETGGGE